MADLFGAPAGIIAAEEMGQRSGINALNSLKLMGDIASQPAEAEYKRGLGRLHNADAESKEQATADARRLAEIHANIARESEGKLAQTGLPLTADEIDPETGRRKQMSPVDQQFEYIEKMRRLGATPTDTAPLLLKTAQTASAVSTAAFREAQKVEREGAARKQQREAIGAIANSLLSNPQTYAQMRLQGTGYPELDQNLPPVFNAEAKKVLEFLRDAAMTPDKAQGLKYEAARTASQVATGKAQQAVAAARVEVLNKRSTLLKADIDHLEKTGGKYSPEAIQARADKAKTDKLKTEVTIAKVFPGIPANPEDGEIGENYSLPDGRRVTVVGKTPDNKYILQPVLAGTPTPVTTGADDEEDDDGE